MIDTMQLLNVIKHWSSFHSTINKKSSLNSFKTYFPLRSSANDLIFWKVDLDDDTFKDIFVVLLFKEAIEGAGEVLAGLVVDIKNLRPLSDGG